VRSQQVGHALAKEALGISAAALAEHHDQDVHLDALGAQAHGELAPVDPCLLAQVGLEAALG